MKILKCLKSAKGIITRLSLIICLGFCLNYNFYSNPISSPPIITEIYFGPGGWSIELLFLDLFNTNNLDSMRITGLYDTAEFIPGIEYIEGEVIVVTQADFQTPFYINQEGDFLHVEGRVGSDWWLLDEYGLPFGDLPEIYISEVCAPVGEESIAWQEFDWSNGGPYFWVVKELPNTIDSNTWYQVSTRATFSGYVKDKNEEPLSWIKLDYSTYDFYHYTTPTVPEIYTDENGYFYNENMFCKRYHFRFLFEGSEIGDTIVCIEPGAANYFEFKLDTLLTSIGEYKPATTSYSIYNIPNPLSNQTTFVVESSGYRQNQKGVIKIYSSEGYIIDILPIEISGEKQELAYNLADKSLAAGIYYYSLEIGKDKKASGKMVISQ
jgi:hypothetical protein